MRSLSEQFEHFAVRYFKASSPLYECLSLAVSKDPELLELAARTRTGQLPPNMLFGAVHYLLLQGTEHPLKYFYPSLVNNPGDPEFAIGPFKDFCRIYHNELIALLESKSVQTNEVNRCAYLYPAFCRIYLETGKPLALIEVGTSAGLQLLWDQYSYSYGTNDVYGGAFAELHLKSEPRGAIKPFLLPHSPPVAARIGIDLHINDLKREEDYAWLKALIWPEHRERRLNLEKAASCLRNTHTLQLIEGDAVKLIAEIAADIPEPAMLCIFHTHVAHQFSADTKRAFMARIEEIGMKRDLYHLYNNVSDLDLHLDAYVNGTLKETTLAETEGHGRWFKWLAAT